MRTISLILCLFFLVACGGPAASEPDAEASAGGDTTQYEGPIASTDVERGKELFGMFCDDCHPDGEDDVGPSLIADPHAPARMRQQIREGSGKMRPLAQKRLGDDDMEALLAFLASINAVN